MYAMYTHTQKKPSYQ